MEFIFQITELFFGLYWLGLLAIYVMLLFMAVFTVRSHFRNKDRRYTELILESDIVPGISIIAPAYNESVTIINNVRSLLTVYYPKFEVVIVNDGSKDDTLAKLIKEFDLVPVDFPVSYKVSCRPIHVVYKSKHLAHSRLIVVDKVNGGSKADAVNAGINISQYPYIVNTDVDCVLSSDTLARLIEPVLNTHKRVIGVGATLRMSNSSYVESGTLVEVFLPKQWLPRFQEMEYMRSYLLGKMSWSRLNCVSNVSGGLGLFEKECLIEVGGYNHKSLGEDMEIITRLCKRMYDTKEDYAVRYIPQTLCWTEGPETLKYFLRQRVRWARGLSQIVFKNFEVFLNPKYGRFGMVVFPAFTVFEFLAPILELAGIIFYVYLIAIGRLNWDMALLLLVFMYFFSVMNTCFSILIDCYIHRYYKRISEIGQLFLCAFLEPITYHPLIVFASLKGYTLELLGRKNSWGEMVRKGGGVIAPSLGVKNK